MAKEWGADAFYGAESIELLASYKACQIGVSRYGQLCIDYIQAAKYEMMSMNHSDEVVDNGTHRAVSKEAVLALIIENLTIDLPSDNSFDVVEVYRAFTAQLVSTPPRVVRRAKTDCLISSYKLLSIPVGDSYKISITFQKS